jgi:hypothetical protein
LQSSNPWEQPVVLLFQILVFGWWRYLQQQMLQYKCYKLYSCWMKNS